VTTNRSDAFDGQVRLPRWQVPASILAFAAAFYYSVNTGHTIAAMVFGLLAIPVMIAAWAGVFFVVVRATIGDYRGRLSVVGAILWLCVTIGLVISSIAIYRTTPWMH
jgi:hypothetical protein